MSLPNNLKLLEAAETAAWVMKIQLHLFREIKPKNVDENTETLAAFAFGVWDAMTQMLSMTVSESVASLPLFAGCWKKLMEDGNRSSNKISDGENYSDDKFSLAILNCGRDTNNLAAVRAGGNALHAFIHNRLDSSLAKCLMDVAEGVYKR